MTKLETEFHPLLVGFVPFKERHNLFHRVLQTREYRINYRSMQSMSWFEIEIYNKRNEDGFMFKQSLPTFRCDTVGSFYTHLFKLLPEHDIEYLAVLNAEYRALLIDDLLKTL